jgi:hypothetical protein
MIRFKFMARRAVSNCACCPQIYIAWGGIMNQFSVCPWQSASRMQKHGCKAAFEFFSFPFRGGNLSFLNIFTHDGKFLELQQENCMLLNNFVIHQLYYIFLYAIGCKCWESSESSHVLLFTRIILPKLKTAFSYPYVNSKVD